MGKVNHVSTETALAAPEVMLGTFDVNSTPATVLFHSGAFHSFISQAFVRMHSIPLCAMKDPILETHQEVVCKLLIIVFQLVYP